MKGRVIYADDNFVKLELQSNSKKLEVPRQHIFELRDPTKPILVKDLQCAPLSFDAAMN